MAYLTHSEYTELGGTLSASAFSLQEFRARLLLDELTHGRVVGDSPVREAVKHAMRALINAQAADDTRGGREVASESNDGVSVSYVATSPGGAYARRVDIVCEYLANEVTATDVPLLYAGVAV
jgi:hypothetical protein